MGKLTSSLAAVANKNVALFSILEHRYTKERIVFGNTHILHNPIRGELKLAQILNFVRVIQKLKTAYKANSVILTGDFNFIPRSMLYSLFTTSRLHLDVCKTKYSNQILVKSKQGESKPIRDTILKSLIRFNYESEMADPMTDYIHYPGPNESALTMDELLTDLLSLDIILDDNSNEVRFFRTENIRMSLAEKIREVENIFKSLALQSAYSELTKLFVEAGLFNILENRGYSLLLHNKLNIEHKDLIFEPLVTHHPKGTRAVVDYIFKSDNLSVIDVLASPKSKSLESMKRIFDYYI